MENICFPPDTKCNECIFFENDSCSINKDKHYNSKGITISKTNKEQLLKEFICPYFRTPNWSKDKERFIHKWEEEIKTENQLPYFCVLLDSRVPIYSIRKILEFGTKPKEIFIVMDKNTTIEEVKETYDELKELIGDKVKWTLYHEFENNAWHQVFNVYNRHDLMLLVQRFPACGKDWAERIAVEIQDNLLKFSYAENFEKTMTLIHPYLYHSYYFEHGPNWLNKLKEERWQQKYIL